jgi:small subunit ribosomal protein S1
MNSESPEASSQGQPPSDPQKTTSENPSVDAPEVTEPTSETTTPAASEGPPEPAAPDAPQADADTSSTPEATETSAEPTAAEPTAAAPTPEPAAGDAGPLRGKIQVGSRRGPAESAPTSSRPQMSGAAKPVDIDAMPQVSGPVTPPSVREPLSADLERELQDALGGASIDDLLADPAGGGSAAVLEQESRHKGAVVRIHKDNVFFSLDGRNEGVASLRQFDEPPEVGAQLDVVVKSYHSDDGIYELAIPGASINVEDWSDLAEGAIVEGRVTGSNTGGLECKVNNIRAFIPASQIAMHRVENFAEFIDQKLLCVVTEVNPNRKNLVLSRRAVLEREREEERQKLLDGLTVGQVCEGLVRNLRDFGAFVDLGGVDGLIHISQLSWDRVNHPSEILQEGQKVRVKIEKIDPQTGKIGLSYRDLLEHPWTNVKDQFSVDEIVKGTVSRLAKFGAFVKLAPGVEGLVHISELSHSRVPTVGSVVSEGDEIQVKILTIDTDSQRIALSMKAVLPEPEREEEVAREESEALPEPTRPKRSTPLKGGRDSDSGGGQFGLKW